MGSDKGRRTSFNPRGAADFLVVCLALGVLILFNAKNMDHAIGFVWMAFLVIASIVLVWRWWKRPDAFKRHGLGQFSVLPRRWKKWILDEHDSDSPR